jgi:hypothetical protein
MPPEQVEAIKKAIEIAAKDPAWCKAITSVIETPNLAKITEAASTVSMSVSSFINQFVVALSEPSKILRPILQNTHLTEGKATQYLFDAQKLVNSGVPEALRAGGAAGVGTTTVVATGIGATLINVAIGIGVIVIAGFVLWGVAGYVGEHWGDQPIEQTWIGGSDIRNVYSAHFTATIDGQDVTNTIWSKPSYVSFSHGEGASLYNYGTGDNVVRGATYGEICDMYDKYRISRSYSPSTDLNYGVYTEADFGLWDCLFSVTCTRKVVGKQRTPRESSPSDEPFRGYKDIVIEGQ